MTPTIILAIALGLLTYWVVKTKSEIKSTSDIKTFREFFLSYWQNMILSLIGFAILILNGPELPLGGGKIDGVIVGFIAGGSIPSMINNLVGMFKAK